MDYGIQLASTIETGKIAKRAEELGFTHAWFNDTQMLDADIFVAMTVAALQTSRIRLCTGVLIPSNRIAPVTACAMASLNLIAPGRIGLGVSTGHTARRAMGLPASTLASMEEYIGVVQGLLKRETVDWRGEGGAHKIRFLNPEIGMINVDDPIPLHISAFGPKSRALTAKLGAGWIGGQGNPETAAAALCVMREAWRAAGRQSRIFIQPTLAADVCSPRGNPPTVRAPRRRPDRALRCCFMPWPRKRTGAASGTRFHRSLPIYMPPIAKSTNGISRRTRATFPTIGDTACSCDRKRNP